jgi:putative hydrolase of the HAD superfamily
MKAIRQDDDTVAIFEGVPDTINRLKEKGFILGIITDTAMHFSRKLSWFDQHGFGCVWDVVISSKEMGARKPHPIMYEEAIRQTGILPAEAVFVGHKAYELEGARAVGMKTIAFNYEKNAVADAYIDTFNELLEVAILKN